MGTSTCSSLRDERTKDVFLQVMQRTKYEDSVKKKKINLSHITARSYPGCGAFTYKTIFAVSCINPFGWSVK
ncbi:hypothetical protein ANCCAN_10530 [Ancylostoma caninum]|uniref:Uncharacterized protein n=1 Tax=Ancylostoma caninum TaxID=29170 RepID=A0A368GIF4_ANCCA|nr:hypothetical protein ANCCAN_10530 [Ancylostoma caninum]